MDLLGLARRLREEDRTAEGGWALMETVFAAVLLVVVALAVMSSLDVASKTSAATKGRSAASSLAEQDQERMRALSIDQLSNYHGATDLGVGGLTYHVDSRAEWVRDSTGAPLSCSDTGQADYIRTTSTVTSSTVGVDTKPVVVRGIVAPPVGSLGATQGTLSVKVSDAKGNPVPNLPVSLRSTTYADNTNGLGCAVFGYIPVGPYSAELNSTGWVDQNDNQDSINGTTVTGGNVSSLLLTYDKAGSVTADLRDSGNNVPSPSPTVLSINNSKWLTAGVRRVSPPTATSLFPFATSPYSVYAGSCVSADPSTYAGETTPSASVLPGAATTGVLVRVPTISVKVVDASNNGISGTVSLRATGSGCTETVNNNGTAADGTVALDMPYGTYRICTSSGAGGKYRVEAGTITNGASAGLTVPNLQPTKTSGTPLATGSGLCPNPLP